MPRSILRVLAACLLGCVFPALAQGFPEHHGADAGGTRYAPLDQITPANVADLVPAWTWSSGDLARRDTKTLQRSKYQATPILADGRLVLCTPFNEVVALAPPRAGESGRSFVSRIIDRPGDASRPRTRPWRCSSRFSAGDS